MLALSDGTLFNYSAQQVGGAVNMSAKSAAIRAEIEQFGGQWLTRAQWAPNPAGLFGGLQIVGNYGGIFPVAAFNNASNWSNNRRATEAQAQHALIADSTNLQVLWVNDVQDQAASGVALTHATPRVEMGLCASAAADPTVLNLYAWDALSTSLGNGTGAAVSVAPRAGVVGKPAAPMSGARSDTILSRVFIDRQTDTDTRFPVQMSQTNAPIPANTGASQNVTGPGTSRAHASKSAWEAANTGRLGTQAVTLLGNTSSPVSNVLVLGDSVENGSGDSTSVWDVEKGYVRRAIKAVNASGVPISFWNASQGNETLQNLATTLATATNARRKLLGAGCWSHVYIGHARNDIQNGRTSAQVIADYTSVLSLIRANTPQYTKVILGTLPPYTNGSNSRLASTVMDEVYAWQTTTAATLFDYVVDVGAVVAQGPSGASRQLWDPACLVEGIHPNDVGHARMADALVAAGAVNGLWYPEGY